LKLGVQFDENGNFVGDFLLGMELREGHTLFEGEIIEGFYQPKLVTGQVIEGLSQEEIDEMRNKPQPITAQEQIASLKVDAQTLDERTVGMQAIDDFTLQAQANIDDRTIGMQEIDDFTLQLLNDQAAIIAQLQADVAQLKGGV
jgi:hypothetical protein